MRLIDIDPILAWANDPEVHEPYGVRGSELMRKLWDAPTIDAVNVVRCKDCIWWINNLTEFSADEDFLQCRWNEEESPNADDFCSYGERKESE